MKINFQSLMNNDVIEPGKLTELFIDGKSVWKGLSENLVNFDNKYTFIKFNNKKLNIFNEAVYKIEVKPLNETKIESKKSFEDEMEYGLPEDKKYPLYDKSHVLSAIKFFNYCDDPEKQATLATAIIEKMKKYNISFDSIGDKNKLKAFLPVLKEEDESKKVEILNNLRKDMQGEFDAIIDYDERAKVAKEAGYTELADTLEDIRDEEKVHVGELQAQLKKLDPEYEKGLIDGEKEVQEEQSKLTEDEEIPEGVTLYDDGDGKGKYFYTDGHRKVYPYNHELDEDMHIRNGKRKGQTITQMNGKPINQEEDYAGHMVKMGDETVVIDTPGRKAYGVGDSKHVAAQGLLVDFEPEITLNTFKYKGKQITPAIQRAYELQKKQAEDAKNYKKEHPAPSVKKDDDDMDIVPYFLKKKDN